MAAVAENNAPPIPRSHLLGFANSTATDAYLLAHPDTVLAAVAFVPGPAPGQLGFVLQSNSSVQWFKGAFQDPNTYIQVREGRGGGRRRGGGRGGAQ